MEKNKIYEYLSINNDEISALRETYYNKFIKNVFIFYK